MSKNRHLALIWNLDNRHLLQLHLSRPFTTNPGMGRCVLVCVFVSLYLKMIFAILMFWGHGSAQSRIVAL